MNIAIVDDNPIEIKCLLKFTKEYFSVNNIDINIFTFDSAEKMLADYRPVKYSIILLDILMFGMSGIEAANRLRELDDEVMIIFTTSSQEYLKDAFGIHAYDYLIKPIAKQRLFKLYDDITRLKTKEEDCLQIYSNKEDFFIPFSSILAIDTSAHYINIYDNLGNTCKIRLTFSSASETLLQDPRFLVVMRGIIVNMDYIVEFKDQMCCLDGNIQFPVSIKNSRDLEQIWQNYKYKKAKEKQS